MPLRLLRFCAKCLTTRQSLAREVCETCSSELQPLLDENGALSQSFLIARGTCCSMKCRNCPYAGDVSSCASTSKTCPRCQSTFGCEVGNCWCEKLRLSPTTLEWLERNFDDCLCPTCLTSFANG